MNRIRDEEIKNILCNLNWNNSENDADLSDFDDISGSNDYFNHIYWVVTIKYYNSLEEEYRILQDLQIYT